MEKATRVNKSGLHSEFKNNEDLYFASLKRYIGNLVAAGPLMDEPLGYDNEVHSNMITNEPAPEIELLRAAYAAFNSRDVDAALALMASDVAWARAFKGGFVQGHQAVRAYWTEQWSEINPHVEPVSFSLEASGCILVEVHLVVRHLAGGILADMHVDHRFTMRDGLIQRMEVCAPPAPNRNA